MLVVSPAGLDAIGVEPEEDAPATGKGGKSRPTTGKPKRKPAGRKPKNAPPPVRPGTKQALLIDLLKRKRGATIDEIVAATGWQPHSVRGAISGAIKKKLDLTVTSEPTEERGRVYRIDGRA